MSIPNKKEKKKRYKRSEIKQLMDTFKCDKERAMQMLDKVENQVWYDKDGNSFNRMPISIDRFGNNIF